MLLLLSPSKAMDFDSPVWLPLSSAPAFAHDAGQLAGVMQTYSVSKLQDLMSLSPKLGALNAQRWAEFFTPKAPSRQAILAFVGDTYKDMPLATYTQEEFEQAQNQVRILSGLYGLLRPLDLISPHRLEMGTRLETDRGASLYEFWGTTIRQAIAQELRARGWDTVVNLASKEYARAARLQELEGVRVVEPVFKDYSKGAYKVVSLWAKRARGMMADVVVREGIKAPERLREFDRGGYRFDASASAPNAPVFLRKKAL